ELTRTQEEVKRVEQERSALQAKVSASDDKQKGELQQATDLGQKVEGALSKRIKQHWATVVTADNNVTVRIPTSILFAPNSLTVTKHGGPFLCEVVTALGSGTFTVAAHTAAAEVNAALAKTYATPWDLTAAQSAAVAMNLIDQCKVEAARVSAEAHADSQPLSGAKPAENARIELSLHITAKQ
ncbi:MAG TPA: hypothetical protein VL137_09760, partial [Polyangiaceae bacterium]|nr:hypothetical protein [Polyangiaceae bacterium]